LEQADGIDCHIQGFNSVCQLVSYRLANGNTTSLSL